MKSKQYIKERKKMWSLQQRNLDKFINRIMVKVFYNEIIYLLYLK